jgi:branched-chain amino acid transport system substrate-binding protein
MSTEEADDVVRRSAMRVLVVMALLLGVASCSFIKDDEAVPEFVVGATLELTGPNADIGKAHQNALNLEAERANASGVLGKRRLRVVTRDNQGKPDAAAAHVTEFANDSSVVGVIAGACSACSVEAAKVANTRQIPLISLAPASGVLSVTKADGKAFDENFVFKLGPNSGDNVRALTTEMVRVTNKSAGLKVGVLRAVGAYPTPVADPKDPTKVPADEPTLASQAGVANIGTVVSNVDFAADGSNLAARVTEMLGTRAADRPDAVFVWALPAQAALAVDALKNASFKGPVYLDGSAAGSLFLSNNAIEGVTIAFPQTLAMDDVIATTPAKATRKQWFEDYTARYGAYHGQSSFAADALDLVATAVGRAGTNRPAVRGVLESVETDGLSGPIRIRPANHSGLMPQALAVFVAKGGRWRLLG